jgi:2-keto-myo-inositol isomerase
LARLEGSTSVAAAEPFRYCLNTSTLNSQDLGIVAKIEIAAEAGYQGIEPWIRELDQYVQEGGNLADLGKRIRDLGLTVEGSIGFAEWIVDDDRQRRQGLEEAKRTMAMVQLIGGSRMAAPPAGARDQANLNLFQAAQRYRVLLDLGEQFGVIPQLEFWGSSKTLSRLSEAALVAVECGHPQAGILADVYHLYKGGSEFTGLTLLNGAALQVFHFNDYPATPSRTEITDAERVYPGDGIAPLPTVLRDLHQIGFHGCLSLELFNRDYWSQDPLVVARTGLEKMRAAVLSRKGSPQAQS